VRLKESVVLDVPLKEWFLKEDAAQVKILFKQWKESKQYCKALFTADAHPVDIGISYLD
jgi:hypothetical protein